MTSLKLYIWKVDLHDYQEGLVFALALDADHARELIRERQIAAGGDPNIKTLQNPPIVIDTAQSYCAWWCE